MKRPRFWIGSATIALVLGGGVFYGWGPGGSVRVVDVPARVGTKAIAQRLRAAGVVRSAWVFRVAALVSGRARRLQAGEYEFAPRVGVWTVVRRLAQGETVRHAFTVPEGFTARQIAEKLTAEGLADGAAFLAVVQDAALAKRWGIPGESLEGFLFPDTYDLPKGLPAEQIAKRMVDEFRLQVGPELIAAGRAQGLDELQLITLASIIEREVKVPEERAKVASVFYNRLHQNIRLESCATVLYSQHRVGGAVSEADLFTASPYNTYRHRGLPPGPICSPGLSSLQAAAHPARTDYLFFVVRPDGEHVFSKDFETHKHAKWAQRRARAREASETPSPAQ